MRKGSKNAMILESQTENTEHESLKAMVPDNCSSGIFNIKSAISDDYIFLLLKPYILKNIFY